MKPTVISSFGFNGEVATTRKSIRMQLQLSLPGLCVNLLINLAASDGNSPLNQRLYSHAELCIEMESSGYVNSISICHNPWA